MRLEVTPNQLNKLFVLYTLTSFGNVKYIGVCKFEDILLIKAPRKKRTFAAELPDPLPMVIDVLTSGTAEHCRQSEVQWLLLNPWPPLVEYVTCVTTGEMFPSVRETASAHGCNPSALRNHLAQRAGYPNVKGRVYRYGVTNNA